MTIFSFMSVGWSNHTINGSSSDITSFTTDNNQSVIEIDNTRDIIWTTGGINTYYYNGDTLNYNFDYYGGYENIIFEIRTGVWNGNLVEGHYFILNINDNFVGEYYGGTSYNTEPNITFIDIQEYIQTGINSIELIFYIDDEGKLGYININGDPVECISGDINGDSLLDIVDIVSMVNLILYGWDNNECHDMNSDQILNVIDIISLINIILSQ